MLDTISAKPLKMMSVGQRTQGSGAVAHIPEFHITLANGMPFVFRSELCKTTGPVAVCLYDHAGYSIVVKTMPTDAGAYEASMVLAAGTVDGLVPCKVVWQGVKPWRLEVPSSYYCLVMPFAGVQLDRIRSPMPPANCVDAVLRVAHVCHRLLAKRLAYTDLKEANVVYDADAGSLTLVDFGSLCRVGGHNCATYPYYKHANGSVPATDAMVAYGLGALLACVMYNDTFEVALRCMGDAPPLAEAEHTARIHRATEDIIRAEPDEGVRRVFELCFSGTSSVVEVIEALGGVV